jgi:tetratricopeptide (TPR) repeat protein
MSIDKSYRKLRIFAASPSDVASERAKVDTAVAALKPLAEHIGLTLEVLDWREAVPDMGRPQQVIFNQLKPTSWDVFIGILWHRFGTPTAAVDAQRQREYLSGTEEEFWTAYRLWKQFGRPRLMMYRCTRQVDLNTIDFDQAKRVKEFFDQFDAVKGEHLGLYQSFDTTEAFEKLLLEHLQKLLITYSEQETKQMLTPQTIAVLAPPRIPNTLPRRAPFFGRKDEIAQAMRALSPEDRGWGAVMDGIGGIGKTALAVEVAYLCKEQGKFDAFVFVSAKRGRLEPSGIQETTLAATTLDAFLNECARAIGRQGIAQLASPDKQRVFLDALRGMRTLLIFDNLETLTAQEQATIGEFLRNLPVECKAIVTSRRRTGEAAVTIRLERLQWDAARELIESEIARHPDVRRALSRVGEAGWKQLYDEAGGSPLALTWTIGLMRARGLRFENALALLRDGSAESDLNAFIYSEAQKRMDANERAALGTLSFFGGPATFEALSAAANLDRRALDVVLERLRALSLVDMVEDAAGQERYALHPLTRRFARADLAKDAQAERAMGMSFARYWLDYARRYGGYDEESYKTYDRLETEWANLEAAETWLWETAAVQGETVGDKDAARMLVDLAEVRGNFLWFGGRWDEQAQLGARAYEAACALQHWNSAGWRAHDVAFVHLNRARTDDAELWADRCAEVWAYGGSKREQAVATRMRGLIAQQREDYDQAIELLQEALAIWRDMGLEKRVAVALTDLGVFAQKRKDKDYDTAERYYREAFDLVWKIDDKEGQTACTANLGRLALDRGQWTEARQWYEQALPLAREFGYVDSIAHAQYGLARVWEAEGRADLALPLAQEALKIYERLQHRDLAEVRELVERLKNE